MLEILNFGLSLATEEPSFYRGLYNSQIMMMAQKVNSYALPLALSHLHLRSRLENSFHICYRS